MNLAITGASGFLGRHIAARLREHTIRAVSTRAGARAQDFAGCDAVIHLAGEPVAQRWTPKVRERIESSRVAGTRAVVDALREHPPKILISASGVGYYGSRGDEILTETSAPGNDFLARVSVEWERAALAAEQFGVRVVLLRISMVLGPDGGALKKMLLPFRLGIGGKLASGEQWMPWIHIDDLAGLVAFAMDHDLSGPINACAPNPVTNTEFTRELARAVHRPAIFPVPKFALNLLFGEMAEMVLASQRVIPQVAQCAGFSFRYPQLDAALRSIL